MPPIEERTLPHLIALCDWLGPKISGPSTQ